MNETLRVEIRFKNARLYQAILERTAVLHEEYRQQQVQRAIGPVQAFCRQYAFNKGEYQRMCQLLALKIGPTVTTGSSMCGFKTVIRPLCIKLAELCDTDVAWLFPQELYQQAWPMLTKNVDATMMTRLTAAPARALLVAATQADDYEKQELAGTMSSVLNTLTPRESRVIKMRYGMDGDESHTVEQTAKAEAVTRGRIRQIEAKALRKLRHPRRSRQLRPFLDDHVGPEHDRVKLTECPSWIDRDVRRAFKQIEKFERLQFVRALHPDEVTQLQSARETFRLALAKGDTRLAYR